MKLKLPKLPKANPGGPGDRGQGGGGPPATSDSCKRGRTANGDCIAKPSGNRKADYSQSPTAGQDAYQARQHSAKMRALAHPTRSLAKLAAGKSLGLHFVEQAQAIKSKPPPTHNLSTGQPLKPAEIAEDARIAESVTAHLDRFTGRLQHKVDRHDAIIARRATRPRY